MTAATAAEYDSLAISGPNQLVVRFRKAYTRQVCERPDRKSRLEQALAKAAGYPIRLEFESAPQSPTPSVQRPTQPTATTRRQRFRDAEQNLLVRAAIEAFDGEVFNVIEPVRTEEGPTLGGEAG